MTPRPAPDDVLAAVLRQLRERRGLSQEAAAHRAGITLSALARIELGRTSPAWATVRHIAQALDVSMADIAAMVEQNS